MGVLKLVPPVNSDEPLDTGDVLPVATVAEVEAAIGFPLSEVPTTVEDAIAAGRVKLLIVSDANCDDAS